MKDLLVQLAAQLPNRSWDCVLYEECLLPYYHIVSDDYVPHVSPIYQFRSISQFKADLDCFLQNRRPLEIEEFLHSVKTTGRPPKESFLLTFDDGFREMHEVVLPILVKKGVPAVFFLSTAAIDNREMCHHQKISLLLNEQNDKKRPSRDDEVLRQLKIMGMQRSDVQGALKAIPWNSSAVLLELERIYEIDFAEYAHCKKPYMDSDEIRTLLQNGMGIGAHSIDHPCYIDIPYDEQLRQTRVSMEQLVQKFDIQPRVFAFPHTDDGVSAKFFKTISDEGTSELFFGTSGPQQDCIEVSFQRFSMEKTNLSARAILARNRLRWLKLRIAGSTIAHRA